MSLKLDKLNTGIKGLDDDLRELFEICDNKERLDAIKQAVANKDISNEEFLKIVPKFLITLSFILSDPQFTLLLGKINGEAVDLTKEAKSLIEKHFANLFENKIAQSMLNDLTKAGQQGEKESIADEAIRGIEYYSIWEDDPPKLTPAVRLALTNKKRKILLNTRMDWEDLAFILKKFSEISVELLEKGKPLAELGQINLSNSQEVLKNIEETLGNLKKIEEIMPIYKAEADKDE
jgi:hypothetical protein